MLNTIEIKYSTSKGVNTYGWTICSLYVDGKKKASTKGGGYDMKGVVLAEYLMKYHGEKLLTLAQDTLAQKLNRPRGMHISLDKDDPLKIKSVSLAGEVGFSCMLDVAAAIGINLELVSTAKNTTYVFHT